VLAIVEAHFSELDIQAINYSLETWTSHEPPVEFNAQMIQFIRTKSPIDGNTRASYQ